VNAHLTGTAGGDSLVGGAGNDTITGGAGDDTISGGGGNDAVLYTNTLDGADIIQGFDGDASGGQDVLDLDALFDSLSVDTADRAGRVQLDDKGASVDVAVDFDGTGTTFTQIATLNTADVITVGQDVLVGGQEP
jgi:Ca2+-binding RTX toxin-like protein